MANQNQVGKVQTVTGLADPAEMGITLTHEHLLFDSSTLRGHVVDPPAEARLRDLYYQPVSSENLGWMRHHAVLNKDNSQLLSIDTAIDETMLYKQFGGGSLVDATSIGIARDPIGLARISRHTGVKIVMGAAHYVHQAHPDDMDERTEDEIFETIVTDVTEGAEGTDVKSGIIGEVGCSWPLTDNERKVLRAAARAQRVTGAPILIHPGRDETAPFEILQILRESGADLERTIMGHVERTIFKLEDFKRVAESGCYVEWDLFGSERSYYGANPKFDMPSDATRMDQIAYLASEGFGDKLVVAHDICNKDRLIKYGGHGYFYIISHIVPRMRARGYTEEHIQKILVHNPARILTFADPESD